MGVDNTVVSMKLWAWMGEDELGSGKIGLKQALVPAGYIPIVACEPGKIDGGAVRVQMLRQAQQYRKTISLVRFGFERIEDQVQ